MKVADTAGGTMRLGNRELDLLALCCRAVLNAEVGARIEQAIRSGVDWDRLILFATTHRVAVLLHRAIFALSTSVPAAVSNRLEILARSQASGALSGGAQLRAILDVLRGSGIEAIPMKGLILSLTAYGDASARGGSIDIDLLVRPEDFARALEVLGQEGYERWEGDSRPDRLAGWNLAANLVPRKGGMKLDLHARLTGDVGRLDIAAVFARSVPRPLLGTTVRTFSTEDQLLYLCLHGTKHSWGRLIWISDVARALQSAPELPWSRLMEEASRARAERPLILGLYLAWSLFEANVPQDIRREFFRGNWLPVMVDLVRRQLVTTTFLGEPPRGLGRMIRVTVGQLAERDSWRARGHYIRARFTPTPEDNQHLPRGLRWLAWGLRPLRILTRWVLGPLLRPVRDESDKRDIV